MSVFYFYKSYFPDDGQHDFPVEQEQIRVQTGAQRFYHLQG